MHEIAAELNVKVDDLLSWQHDFASQHQVWKRLLKRIKILFATDKPVEEKIFNGELKAILRTKLEDLNEQQLMV